MVRDGTVRVLILRLTRADKRCRFHTTGGTLVWTVETHVSKIILFYIILYYIMNDLSFVIKSDSFIQYVNKFYYTIIYYIVYILYHIIILSYIESIPFYHSNDSPGTKNALPSRDEWVCSSSIVTLPLQTSHTYLVTSPQFIVVPRYPGSLRADFLGVLPWFPSFCSLFGRCFVSFAFTSL